MHLQPLLASGPVLHAVICCSGAFACSPVESPEFLSEAQHLVQANCYPSMLCAHVAAALFTSRNREEQQLPPPLVVLTGAAAVTDNKTTPSMIAYGSSKAYVHHLVRSLAAVASAKAGRDAAERDDESALPFRAVGILPEMLDTPANRESMPDVTAEQRRKTWTEPRDVAEKLLRWARGEEKATNGGLYVIRTREGLTEFVGRRED